MRRIAILAAALLTAIAARPLPSRAATPFTEDFAGGSNGWVSANGAQETGSWSIEAGVAQRSFAPIGFPLPGDYNTYLIASNAAASGAFAGDYLDANILLVGFDFRYFSAKAEEESVLLAFQLCSGTNTLMRELYKPSTGGLASLATGTWHTIRTPLMHPVVDGWFNATPGATNAVIPDSLWEDCLSSVDSLRIVLKRGSTTSQVYQVDNVFLDSLPRAAAVDVVTTGAVVRWEGLRSNTVYRMEASTNVTLPTWSSVDLFTATSGVHFVSDPTATNGEPRTYRVRTE